MTWNSYSWDDTDPIYFDNIGWTLFENYETDELSPKRKSSESKAGNEKLAKLEEESETMT